MRYKGFGPFVRKALALAETAALVPIWVSHLKEKWESLSIFGLLNDYKAAELMS